MAPNGEDGAERAARSDLLQRVGSLIAGPGNRPLLWERRGRWQIGFRWIVPPTMLAAVLVGRWLGFEFAVLPVLAIAAIVAAYNAAFAWIFHRHKNDLLLDPALDRRLTIFQAACDYGAVFLLVYLTGGAWSPLTLFLIFHVVIVAIQFPSPIAYGFAACAAGGTWLLLLCQVPGWLPVHVLLFRGQALHSTDRPMYPAVLLVFFTVTVFLTVAMVGQIMRLLRDQVRKLGDTTAELARANEAVEALVRERTQLMLEVAHNLRAPLAASLDMLEVLRDGYLGPVRDKQTEYLERVDRRLRTLHETIGGLLTIARTRDRSRAIPDVVIDVHDLAEHVRDTFQAMAAEKRLRFEVVAEPGLPQIDSGADLLEQVMENLVSNAIKYTPDEGEVAVRFSHVDGDELRIEVRDTGIGIPADEQENLFREFFRASNAKRQAADGTGLGLTLVKQSVERHHGRVALTSEEGRGTTVLIHLPVRQTPR